MRNIKVGGTKSWRAAFGVTTVAVVLLGTAGVASAGFSRPATSGTVSVNVGTKTPIKLKNPMKIAIFTSAASASFGAAQDAAMTKYAAAHRMGKLTIFDSAFNSALQFKQLQAAIQTKKYNVLGVLPVDGQPICKLLSVNAPKAGLLVTVFDQPLCGRFTKLGNGLYQPGTLNYISGYDTKTTLTQWINAIVQANPGKQTVGLVEGVASDGLSTNINNIIASTVKAHPDFNVVATANTDYSSELGYTQTQAMLQAHPDITVIIASQSNITQGAARAIAQAGLTKKVFLADYGGDKAVVDLMLQGQLALTTPTWPVSEGKMVLQVLIDASHGIKAKKFISLPFKVITPQNVANYQPEY